MFDFYVCFLAFDGLFLCLKWRLCCRTAREMLDRSMLCLVSKTRYWSACAIERSQCYRVYPTLAATCCTSVYPWFSNCSYPPRVRACRRISACLFWVPLCPTRVQRARTWFAYAPRSVHWPIFLSREAVCQEAVAQHPAWYAADWARKYRGRKIELYRSTPISWPYDYKCVHLCGSTTLCTLRLRHRLHEFNVAIQMFRDVISKAHEYCFVLHFDWTTRLRIVRDCSKMFQCEKTATSWKELIQKFRAVLSVAVIGYTEWNK